MTDTAATSELWSRHDDPGPARERLDRVVAELTRARGLQIVVDHAFLGLLVGLCLATVIVLVGKLLPHLYSPWRLALLAIGVAVAAAAVVGWLRRPDPLSVAIRADLALRLKQRLSTAWELAHLADVDPQLRDRLALQAIRAGLPARPRLVFPLRVNRWGRLAPLAATALLLVAVIDLGALPVPQGAPADERVVGEGQRLAAFARAMQERAERASLPRAQREAVEIERLGARMESGGLSRGEAVQQLRSLDRDLDAARMQAQNEARRSGAPSPGGARRGLPADVDPQGLLDRMQSGDIGESGRQALRQRVEDLERAGIPRREMEDALSREAAGEPAPLEEILQKLAQIKRALAEDQELQAAREQVLRSRDNLGDSEARSQSAQGPATSFDLVEDESDGAPKAGSTEGRRHDSLRADRGRQAGRSGSQGDSSSPLAPEQTPYRPDPAPQAPVLSAPGQMRTGESFSSEGRVLPRANRPEVPSVPMNAQFASQVEEVLAAERYPAHMKEFVRRYFLSLSQGESAAAAAPAEPRDERGAP